MQKIVKKMQKFEKMLTLAAGAAGSREAGGQPPGKGGRGRPGRSRASAEGRSRAGWTAPVGAAGQGGRGVGDGCGRRWREVAEGRGWWWGEGAERRVVAAARR